MAQAGRVQRWAPHEKLHVLGQVEASVGQTHTSDLL